MAGRSVYSTVLRNAALDADGGMTEQFNSGVIRFYAGAQPATPETAITSQTLLATLTLAATAFGAAASGVATAAAIAAVTAVASGIANFARILKSDGTTVLMDVNIGNQAVTLAADAAGGATSLTVAPLAQPAFSGQDLWFVDATSGVLKKASLSANAAAGATAVSVTALADAIANASVSGQCVSVVNPSIVSGTGVAISSLTLTVGQTGT